VNKQIAAIVEKMTGVPAAVTQKVADRIAESGMLEPKKVQQQVNAARMIGKMAVEFGSKKLAAKLQDVSNGGAASSSVSQTQGTRHTDEPNKASRPTHLTRTQRLIAASRFYRSMTIRRVVHSTSSPNSMA